MKMSATKNKIVDEFLQFKGIRDVTQIDAFIKRIEAAIGSDASPAPDLMYMVVALRANREDSVTSDFAKSRAIAAPVFTWLTNKADWSFVQIAILQTVIYHAESYQLAHTLTQKALEALKYNYATERYQREYIYTIYFSMTFRLLRAKYYDIENLEAQEQEAEVEKIEALFNQYLQLSREMVPADTRHIMPMMLNVREALFNNDCDGIVAHLEDLRRVADKPTYRAMRLEVIEHLGSKIQNLTNPLYNLLVGSRIQYHRKQKLKTTKELAKYLGTSVTVVNNIESGWRGASPERLFSIAKFLDVEVAELNGHSRTTKPIVDEIDPRTPRLLKIWNKVGDSHKDHVLDLFAMSVRYLRQLDGNEDDDMMDDDMIDDEE